MPCQSWEDWARGARASPDSPLGSEESMAAVRGGDLASPRGARGHADLALLWGEGRQWTPSFLLQAWLFAGGIWVPAAVREKKQEKQKRVAARPRGSHLEKAPWEPGPQAGLPGLVPGLCHRPLQRASVSLPSLVGTAADPACHHLLPSLRNKEAEPGRTDEASPPRWSSQGPWLSLNFRRHG